MLDINYIKNNQEKVKTGLLKRLKEEEFNLEELTNLDEDRKQKLTELEQLKAEKNKHSKNKPTPEIIKKMKNLGKEIKERQEAVKKLEITLKEKLSALPNIPSEDVVAGGKENNKPIYTFKEKPKFNFTPKDHVELATDLNLIDYKRAVKMSGNGFWIYTNKGAWLEWALLNYFIHFHQNNGYQFILPPYLLNEDSAYASGHLPKFKDDLFWTQDKLCLNATAEMMLGNYHREEILNSEDLPLKYFAYSACFRREAGSYRQEERGMIRGHQFNKIEFFQFTSPENSWQAFEDMQEQTKKIVENLNLHFRISQLAAEDCSAAMAKTNDIEVWIPSMETYKEVSSVSNATDYQARRGSIRYKNPETSKNEYVHTLNASGLATSRLIPAILEQFQQEDGTVKIPEVLKPYLPQGWETLS